MCLVFLAKGVYKKAPFALVFNRDEVYVRKTAVAHWWVDYPTILGGRDLQRGGSWGGINKDGKFAFLTFWRDGPSIISPRSRGELVKDFLAGDLSATEYLEKLKADLEGYLGFNILLGKVNGNIFHFSNVTGTSTQLEDGIHGLSNADINCNWPKVKKGVEKLQLTTEVNPDALIQMMADTAIPKEEELPDTQIGIVREKMLSPMFIVTPDYGTRCTTAIILDAEGKLEFVEKTHVGDPVGEVKFEWFL